jgi:glycine oxidase
VSRPVDVAVAGGGLIGLSVAWRAAQRGLSVTVVDDAPGRGASWAAAGMLAPVSEAGYGEESLLRLCLASLESYPAFLDELAAATGVRVPLRTAGTLVAGFDDDDMRVLAELQRFHVELGLEVHRLLGREARRREPSLSPRVRGALHVAGDLSVDPRELHPVLLAAAEGAGVRVVRSRVTGLLSADGRAGGLALEGGGEVHATTVVLALGPQSGRLHGTPPVPVRPVKGQILRLRGARGLLAGTVRALVRGRSVYLVPQGDDGLVVGATVEDRGFDSTVTAGGVHDLLHDAIELVPGVTELELAETLTRWRPGTPDNAPLLGASGMPGLVLATGHHRNGVLLTPLTGELVAELIVSGEPPTLAAPFTLDRFGRGPACR